MKKFSLISLSLASLLSANSDIGTMFENGKVDGQIRFFHIDRAYDGAVTTHRNGSSVSGKIKFDTATYNGFNLGLGLYTTHRALRELERDAVDPTLFGENLDSYSILGEAYITYKTNQTLFKFGRQKIDTPLAGSDDARALPNLFEAYLAINNSIKDTTIIAGQVEKFAAGSFSNAYGANGLALSSGYGLMTDSSGQFVNMGKYALNGDDTNGVSVISAIYSGVKNTKIQLWDYVAYDILNAVYAQVDTSWKCLFTEQLKPFASMQYINQSEIGDELAGNIDASFYGIKAGAAYNNFKGYMAYSVADDSGSIISPWGGMAAFTQGMVTRHQYLAGTKAFKLAGTFNHKNSGLNATSSFYYTNFEVDEANTYKNGESWDTDEFGLDLKYYPMDKLQLRFRANFPMDFAKNVDWNEYRFIANYNF